MGKLIEIGKSGTGNIQFQIDYAPPFGGINSSAPPPYISSNDFMDMNNMLVIDNAITPVALSKYTLTGFVGTPTLLGVIDFNNILFLAYQTSSLSNSISIYRLNIPIGNLTLQGTVSSTNATPRGFGNLTYKTINGVCYFSAQYCDSIFKLDSTLIPTVLTNYIGGSYLSELNGRLILGDVTQTSGGTTKFYPYQFAWSAAAGNYAQWNPLVGGLVTGAGFNNLPDVEDSITGIWTTGPDAYIVRQQGVTEVTPLNSGIQPFDFNHLWASHKGIGTLNPSTLAQYGSVAMFLSETDVMSFGYEGINAIGGKAKSYIYETLGVNVDSGNVCGGALGPFFFNGETFLAYALVGGPTGTLTPRTVSVLLFDTSKKEWYKINLPAATNIVNVITSSVSFLSLVSGPVVGSPITGSTFVFAITTTLPTVTTLYYVNNVPASPNTTSSVVFPVEEIAMGRDITIDGILVYLNNNTPGTQVTASVNGVAFSGVTSTDQGWQNLKLYPTLGSPYTGPNPQLTINSINNFTSGFSAIGKISMFGSFDPSQRPI